MKTIDQCKWIVLLVGVSMFIGGQAAATKLDWYLTPGFSYIVPDSNRKADGGLGLQLGIGTPVGKSVHLEFTAIADTLPQSIGTKKFEQRGWLLDGLYFFWKPRGYSAYGLVGVGALQTEFATSTETRYRSALNAGVGLISHRLLKTDRAKIRTDIRYRVDESNYLKQNRFGDWLINFSLYIPLNRSKTSSSRSMQTHDTVQSQPVVRDGDQDGVPDSSDACPSTPGGDLVNESGCELDTDNDGISDGKDRCPQTEMDSPVDRTGCEPVSEGKNKILEEEDEDLDGVPNGNDTCQSTPPGVAVNATGCELDQDGDQIVDRLDKCPQSGKGEQVDADGCKMSESVVLKGVNFDVGSDRLLPSSISVLDSVAQTLKRYPNMVVEIAGYTDSKGKESANKTLSGKRANAVTRYLIIKGVLAANIIAKGYGSESPIEDNSTPEGRTLNRRVELHVLDQ